MFKKKAKGFTPVAWTAWPEVEGRFEWLACHMQRTDWGGDWAWEPGEKTELVEWVQVGGDLWQEGFGFDMEHIKDLLEVLK